MHESIYIAASAGMKQARKMEVIAQNLANVNNSGYKRDALVFKEMMPPFLLMKEMKRPKIFY